MEAFEKIYLYQRIVRAKLFIDKYYSSTIDLANISDQAHFSKFHFIRLFKSIYGKTPHNYLIEVRLNAALLLLKNGQTVVDTCMTLGFDSTTTFSAKFKKHFGKSPTEYQKKELQKLTAIKNNPFVAIPNCFAESHGYSK